MKTLRNKCGFTLVEMLTVIVIIGILAGMLFKIGALVSNRTSRALGASRLEHLKLCIERYYGVYGEYPRATGVTWEDPGASAGPPEDWDIILPGAQAGNPAWENPDKEYWEKLYPYIYRDAAAFEWQEFSAQAGGGGAGLAINTNDSGELGFEYGGFTYTNRVLTIYDGMGGTFHYDSQPPYQTYDLTASAGMGTGWTQ
jgi:prepilin-type N-terminal cleavage/methylation domain-containing protein